MASGINFNPVSFQGTAHAPARKMAAAEQEVAQPSDGFQASGAGAPSKSAPVSAGVTMTATPQQIATAAFQQTLATLVSQGIPVSIVLSNASEAQPNPGSGGSGVSREELRELKSDVQGLTRQMDRMQSEMGFISDKLARLDQPKPRPTPPPTYGGD